MDARYIFAGTLAKTREKELLSDTQLEMLLSAKTLPEFFTALQDTYLAPHITGNETADGLRHALESSITDGKKLLTQHAPQPQHLSVLWVKYDFYNLRTIIKSDQAGLNEEATLRKCFTAGLYDPAKLYTHYHDGSLSTLDTYLAQVANRVSGEQRASVIDHTIHVHYFTTAREMARRYKSPFICRFVTHLIDIYNVVSRLRILARKTEIPPNVFVEGGTFSHSELEDKQQVIDAFRRIGGADVWTDALHDYQESGNFSLIEKTADEEIVSFLDRESFELFSLAPLYAYFTALKNNAQIIRAIYVGKVAGLSEQDIRFTLRKLYR